MGNACFTSFGKVDVKGIKLMCETYALQVWAKLTNTGMQGMGATHASQVGGKLRPRGA